MKFALVYLRNLTCPAKYLKLDCSNRHLWRFVPLAGTVPVSALRCLNQGRGIQPHTRLKTILCV